MSTTSALNGSPDPALESKAINTIRMLAADGVQAAKVWHPGMPMGMAPAAFTCGRVSCTTIPLTQAGPIEIASCSAQVTVRCCSILCYTSPVTICRWRS
jgi:hypothetical protein